MRLLILCILPIFFSFQANGQGDCGTVPNDEQLSFMEMITSKNNSRHRTEDDFLAEIPIKAHILRQSNGNGGLTEAQLNAAIDVVNDFYVNTSIQFFLDGSINYIDNDDYYDFDSDQEESLAVGNDVSRVINVYFANTLDNGGLCGYTRFPPSVDRIFLANSCVTGGNTFAHELGHYFTLFHTHGKTNTGTTDELVDGSNCEIAGDDVCDTPADPNLSGLVAGDCSYTGSARDANGDLYAPMVSNIMSYAIQGCRDRFTAGQYERVRTGFEEGRNYLKYKVDNFQARFLADTRETCIGSTVQYSSLSEQATSWFWEFEGGIPASSNQENPVVRYDEAGVFTAKLTASTSGGVNDSELKSGFMKVIDPVIGAIDYTVDIPFESQLPVTWEIVNNDRAFTFEYSNVSKTEDGTGSMFLNIYDYATETPNVEDKIVTPFISNLGVKAYTISFDYAYTYHDEGILNDRYDSLKVGINFSCGDASEIVWQSGGEELATVDPVEGAFIPSTEDQWKNVSFSVALDGASEFMRVEFIAISDNGNNLLIDNIKIIPDISIEAPTFFRRSTSAEDYYTFRWADNAINEINYVMERAVDGGDFEILEILPPNTTLFIDQTAVDGKMYRYRLYGQGRGDEQSLYTNVVEVFNNVTSLSLTELNSMSYYPNPVKDKLYLTSDVIIKSVKAIGLMGSVHQDFMLIEQNEETILDMSSLSQGFYFIKIEFIGGLEVIKIFKSK